MLEKTSANTYRKVKTFNYLERLEELTTKDKVKASLKGFVIYLAMFEVALFITILVIKLALWLTN
jgi:hypothetical protein